MRRFRSRGSPVRLFGGSTAIGWAVVGSGGAPGGKAQLSVSTSSKSDRNHRAIIAVLARGYPSCCLPPLHHTRQATCERDYGQHQACQRHLGGSKR